MPRIQFGANAYEYEAYNLPVARLENWHAQAVDERGDWAYRLIPTPGLVQHTDTGGSIGRGAFQSDAVAGGSIIYALDTSLRKVASNGASSVIAGAITNDSKPVRFASSQSQLVMCSGGDVYTVDGSAATDFTANLTGAGASGQIVDVDVLNNRHLFVEDNSGRLFYSDPGNATSIAGFVTAESDPDELRSVLVVGASAILFGSKRTEFWIGTESVTTPLIPRQGFVIDLGVINSFAKTKMNGAAYWVANNNKVYEWFGGREREISSPWIETKIRELNSANKALIRMNAHAYGNSFINLHIPGVGDYFFDVDLRVWHRRRPLGNDTLPWGFDYFVEAFDSVYVQSVTAGHLYRLDSRVFKEAGNYVRRLASALVPIDGSLSVRNMVIEGQPGVGIDATAAQEGNPQMMFRVSRDARTFEGEILREIGRYGDHRWRPVIGSLGTFTEPVAMMELAYADAVGWTVYGATYNQRVY